MPTSSVTSTATGTVVQKIQTTYGPQAQALGQSAANAYASHLTTLDVVSVVISTIFIALIVYLIIQTGIVTLHVERIQDVVLKSDTSKKLAKSSWDDIERHFFAGDDSDLKIALIEADHLLDEALHGAGVPGATIGDRLKKVRPEQLPNVDDVWQAHKLRNRIAHEGNFVLKRDLAERALTVYEKALENLGLLDPEDVDGKLDADAETQTPGEDQKLTAPPNH